MSCEGEEEGDEKTKTKTVTKTKKKTMTNTFRVHLRGGRYCGDKESGEGEEEGDEKTDSTGNHLTRRLTPHKWKRLGQEPTFHREYFLIHVKVRVLEETFGDIRKDPQEDKTHRQLKR